MKEEEREAKDQPSRLSRRISERKAQSLDKDKMGKWIYDDGVCI